MSKRIHTFIDGEEFTATNGSVFNEIIVYVPREQNGIKEVLRTFCFIIII